MHRFNDLSLRAKIIAGFVPVAALAGLIGYVGITNIRSVDGAATSLYAEHTVPLGKAGHLRVKALQIQMNLRELIIADSDAENAAIQGEVDARVAEIQEIIEEYDALVVTGEDRALFDAYKRARADYLPVQTELINLAISNRNREAWALLRGDGQARLNTMLDAAKALADYNVKEAEQQALSVSATADRAVNYMLLALVLAIALALALGAFLARTISRPVMALNDAAQKVAAGDTSATVEVSSRDEVGALGSAFNAMTANIRELVATANAAAAEAADASRSAEEARRVAEGQQAYLAQSVGVLLHEMEAFAEGDLTVSATADRDDDIGKLFNGFNRTVTKISQIIGLVGESVEATASASAQISSSAEELAAGAQEQSAQAGEVSAAVEEMTRTIVANSQSAGEAAAVAENSGKVATEGGRVVGETVAKIEEIARVVSRAAATVTRLGDSSREIGEITAVIDGIADQTNLLALNAAIEAARAGEHGRGFAVVADEVRKLAERTSEATKQIAAMIRSIQHETEDAVTAMSRGNEEVSEGIRLAGEARSSLERMVKETRSVEDRVAQIAAASEQQSATSEQISRSVEAISAVSGESAAGITQIARGTDDLNRLTEELRRLVGTFRTASGKSAGNRAAAAAPQYARGDGMNRLPSLN